MTTWHRTFVLLSLVATIIVTLTYVSGFPPEARNDSPLPGPIYQLESEQPAAPPAGSSPRVDARRYAALAGRVVAA